MLTHTPAARKVVWEENNFAHPKSKKQHTTVVQAWEEGSLKVVIFSCDQTHWDMQFTIILPLLKHSLCVDRRATHLTPTVTHTSAHIHGHSPPIFMFLHKFWKYVSWNKHISASVLLAAQHETNTQNPSRVTLLVTNSYAHKKTLGHQSYQSPKRHPHLVFK